MNILFAYYPLFVRFNHGEALLTAICKEKGIDADYVPCGDEFINRMKNYDTIGFSFCCNKDYEATKPYMKLAKEAGKTVLAGGVYMRRGAFIDPNLVDYVCRGEAEIIADFFLNGDTKVFDEKYYQKELDGLPMPDLTNVTGYEFDRGWKVLQGLKIIPYQTARGCPYKCSFCEIQFQPKGIRMKHTIHKDLTYIMETYHPDMVYLFDEQPPYYSTEWREQWKDLYVPFFSYIRADIEPEHLEFIIAHGLKGAAFGVESGNEEYRNKVLNKNLTNEQIFRTVEILKKHNIVYIPFYMTNMPGEEDSGKMATQSMIHQIGGLPIVWQYEDLWEGVREMWKFYLGYETAGEGLGIGD